VTVIAGQCLCGAVAYRCDGRPLATANCHCRDCQRQTGSAFSILVAVRAAGLHVTGDALREYETTGEDSGLRVRRRFCGRCGSPIVSLPDATPGLAYIKAGTLDDPSWLRPTVDVWCDSRQPWVSLDDTRAAFARDFVAPPASRG
jgi:hypothetical protein